MSIRLSTPPSFRQRVAIPHASPGSAWAPASKCNAEGELSRRSQSTALPAHRCETRLGGLPPVAGGSKVSQPGREGNERLTRKPGSSPRRVRRRRTEPTEFRRSLCSRELVYQWRRAPRPSSECSPVVAHHHRSGPVPGGRWMGLQAVTVTREMLRKRGAREPKIARRSVSGAAAGWLGGSQPELVSVARPEGPAGLVGRRSRKLMSGAAPWIRRTGGSV